MEFKIKNIDGSSAGNHKVRESVFGIQPNLSVVRQAVLSELSNKRQGTHSSKNRSSVNGGGKKPWKQKGRGAARAGTIRSPLWRGGGTIFGPSPHKYYKKLSKKASALARCSVLSSKASNGDLIVLSELSLESHRTSDFILILDKLELTDKKVVIVTSDHNKNLILAAGNLKNISLKQVGNVSTYDLINCDVVIFDKNSISRIEELLKN